MAFFVRKRSLAAGFTLIEVVLASALTVLVGLAVYKAFSNGMAIVAWQSEDRAGSRINVFMDKISYDLVNSFNISTDSFVGVGEKISFYVHKTELLSMPLKDISASGYTGKDSVTRVEYIFDSTKGTIDRYEYAYDAKSPMHETRVISGIKDASFCFYVLPAKDAPIQRIESWKGVVPRFIEIVVKMCDSNGEEKLYYRRVEIPLAG